MNLVMKVYFINRFIRYCNFQNSLTKKYPKFSSYLTNLYRRKEKLILWFWKDSISRGQNTNNISEAGIKIVKGVMLERIKAYFQCNCSFSHWMTLNHFMKWNFCVYIAANRLPQYLKKKNVIQWIRWLVFSYKPDENYYFSAQPWTLPI